MKFSVTNETSKLEAVVLGIGLDQGEPIGMNPMMRKHIAENTFPTQADVCRELGTFEKVLHDNDVQIFRPENIKGVEQIFTRDIGFVIDDKFCVSKMKHEARSKEFPGVSYLLNSVDQDQVVYFPDDALIEGGDVLLLDDHILVGLGDRTNRQGLEQLKANFPHKEIVGLELIVDQEDANRNILHLDCTFQPLGNHEAIIYEDGFVKAPEVIYDLYSEDQLIKVSQEQKTAMFPNVFSIDQDKVVIEKGFVELKDQLLQRGYQVFEVDFSETSKHGGLLRCSTLPLRRG